MTKPCLPDQPMKIIRRQDRKNPVKDCPADFPFCLCLLGCEKGFFTVNNKLLSLKFKMLNFVRVTSVANVLQVENYRAHVPIGVKAKCQDILSNSQWRLKTLRPKKRACSSLQAVRYRAVFQSSKQPLTSIR